MKQEIDFENILISGIIQVDIIEKALLGIYINASKYNPLIADFLDGRIKIFHNDIVQVSYLSDLFYTIACGNNLNLLNLFPFDLGLFDKYGCNDYKFFLIHMRNSIVHNRFKIYNDNSFQFIDIDEKGNEVFLLNITLSQIETFTKKIQENINFFYDQKIRDYMLDKSKDTQISKIALIIAGLKQSTFSRNLSNKSLYQIPKECKETNIASYITPSILIMFYCFVLTREEDVTLYSLSPQKLNIKEKYGCIKGTDFLRHMRNSIAHSRYEVINNNGFYVFYDCDNGKENFRIEITPESLRTIVFEFKNICIQKIISKLIREEQIISVRLSSLLSSTGNLCGCINLTQYDLPDNIIVLSDWACCNCKKLERLKLPSSLEEIGKWAFSGCKSLNSLILPQTLKIINEYAFEKCINIKSIEIPSTVILKRRIFYEWTQNQNITINFNNSINNIYLAKILAIRLPIRTNVFFERINNFFPNINKETFENCSANILFAFLNTNLSINVENNIVNRVNTI